MGFVYKCLAVKDPKKPIRTRCKKRLGKEQGVLCKDCKKKAKEETIYVLMHREVTENFNIPWKNQVTVPIFLGNKNDKPESKFQSDEKKRDMKRSLFEELKEFSITEVKEFWLELKLGQFNPEGFEGEYKIHYYSCCKIIDKFIELSK